MIADDLRDEALRLGFTAFGIVAPDSPRHLSKFEEWLNRGAHADMAYLAAQRSRRLRANPRELLPGCASILSLAITYPSPSLDDPAAAPPLAGRVASYAWGRDYHLVIPELLEKLAYRIQVRLGRSFRWIGFTDSAPILERDVAQAAGLGWIGKNTCLILPGQGSYVFLAELFTDLQLPQSAPFVRDFCGTCQRCIQACPTACIQPDRTLDVARCISYLTIENRGAIPDDLRPYLSNWIFGCDICQMVCPWNRRFARQSHPALAPLPGRQYPDLLAEMKLTPEAFKTAFAGSPLLRAKRHGYLRNVAVALGNSASAGLHTHLTSILEQEPDSLVREHLEWALQRLG